MGKEEKNTGMAIIAYILFFIPLLTDAKDDPFVKYHVKQGLMLFICGVATTLISLIPFLGWILTPFLTLGVFVLFIIGIKNVLDGEEKPLPLIGEIGEKFNI